MTTATAEPTRKNGVFAPEAARANPEVILPEGMEFDTRLKLDGREFLSLLQPGSIPAAFFDPQYRGVLDKLNYGNEGKTRVRMRFALRQMPESVIREFIKGIDRTLVPSGHLFLWVDKFHLCQGVSGWAEGTELKIVDLVVWHKSRFGMGYRTRRKSEFLCVLQKDPQRAKGIWRSRSIPDVIEEKSPKPDGFAHRKPVGLQATLIEAVTGPGDTVIDPAAGSFSVMEAARRVGRRFLGCDIEADVPAMHPPALARQDAAPASLPSELRPPT